MNSWILTSIKFCLNEVTLTPITAREWCLDSHKSALWKNAALNVLRSWVVSKMEAGLFFWPLRRWLLWGWGCLLPSEWWRLRGWGWQLSITAPDIWIIVIICPHRALAPPTPESPPMSQFHNQRSRRWFVWPVWVLMLASRLHYAYNDPLNDKNLDLSLMSQMGGGCQK